MKQSIVCCPGGESSQTGSAANERYPKKTIKDCGLISAVPDLLNSNNGPFAIPIWNSNQGEIISAEYVWDHIEQEAIKIFDIWPKSIEFWYVVKTASNKKCGKIGSVIVAKTQCKNFLIEQKADLLEYKLTNYAYDDYKLGVEMDGVLVAPGQGENDAGFKVLRIPN